MQDCAPAGGTKPAAILLVSAIAGPHGTCGPWFSLVTSDQIELLRLAVVIEAFQFHEHAAAVAEQGLHKTRDAVEELRKRQRAGEPPGLDLARQQLDDLVAGVAGKAGMKVHGLQAGIALWQQVEIGYIACAEQPKANRARKFVRAAIQPARHVDPPRHSRAR